MYRWKSICSYSLFLAVSILLLPGCSTMQMGQPPGPWHEAYEPIEDADTEAFVFQSLEKAKQQFGEPVIPVNEIIFRRSRKTEAARRYRIGEDFSLTQCIDPTNGVFVIYIGVDPDHENYYPLLGHECAHLINAQITDWYMEGIATVFSEEVCADADKGWGSWERHFSRSRKYPYALSYRMMAALKDAYPDQYPELLQFAVSNGKGPTWQQIDIDAWLATLPGDRVDEALDIIEPNVKVLRKQVNDQYGFSVPAALD